MARGLKRQNSSWWYRYHSLYNAVNASLCSDGLPIFWPQSPFSSTYFTRNSPQSCCRTFTSHHDPWRNASKPGWYHESSILMNRILNRCKLPVRININNQEYERRWTYKVASLLTCWTTPLHAAQNSFCLALTKWMLEWICFCDRHANISYLAIVQILTVGYMAYVTVHILFASLQSILLVMCTVQFWPLQSISYSDCLRARNLYSL